MRGMFWHSWISLPCNLYMLCWNETSLTVCTSVPKSIKIFSSIWNIFLKSVESQGLDTETSVGSDISDSCLHLAMIADPLYSHDTLRQSEEMRLKLPFWIDFFNWRDQSRSSTIKHLGTNGRFPFISCTLDLEDLKRWSKTRSSSLAFSHWNSAHVTLPLPDMWMKTN
jgi:hypothetical protein